MSTSKLDTSGVFQPLTVSTQQTRLTLPAGAVRIRKNGIEFRSANALPTWTEMSVAMKSPRDNKTIHCTGVVVACTGNRHAGYQVSMVLMNLSRQSQEQLSVMAYSRLA